MEQRKHFSKIDQLRLHSFLNIVNNLWRSDELDSFLNTIKRPLKYRPCFKTVYAALAFSMLNIFLYIYLAVIIYRHGKFFHRHKFDLYQGDMIKINIFLNLENWVYSFKSHILMFRLL